jgi:hypothetical protein
MHSRTLVNLFLNIEDELRVRYSRYSELRFRYSELRDRVRDPDT